MLLELDAEAVRIAEVRGAATISPIDRAIAPEGASERPDAVELRGEVGNHEADVPDAGVLRLHAHAFSLWVQVLQQLEEGRGPGESEIGDRQPTARIAHDPPEVGTLLGGPVERVHA